MGAQATLPFRVTQRRLNNELTPTTCSRNHGPGTCSTGTVSNPLPLEGSPPRRCVRGRGTRAPVLGPCSAPLPAPGGRPTTLGRPESTPRSHSHDGTIGRWKLALPARFRPSARLRRRSPRPHLLGTHPVPRMSVAAPRAPNPDGVVLLSQGRAHRGTAGRRSQHRAPRRTPDRDECPRGPPYERPSTPSSTTSSTSSLTHTHLRLPAASVSTSPNAYPCSMPSRASAAASDVPLQTHNACGCFP